MRICPRCQMQNKKSEHYCVNCSQYIGNVADTPYDENAVKNIIEKSEHKSKTKRNLLLCIPIGFLVSYNIFMMYICYSSFGNLDFYLKLVPYYIPILIIFILPYNKVYGYILKKRGLPKKNLSDFVLNIFRTIGIVLLFSMIVLIFDAINVPGKDTPILDDLQKYFESQSN